MRVTLDIPDDLAAWLVRWSLGRASPFDSSVNSRNGALLYALRYAREMAEAEEQAIDDDAAGQGTPDEGQLFLPFPWKLPKDDNIPF